jgi:trehalose 6-phosphate phosphatase
VRYLFSRAGLACIHAFLSDDTLLAFDFDGTLAPIVKKRDRAALPAKTARLLKQLTRRAPVALLSGRALEDLRARVPFSLVALVGNHGMEGVPGGKSHARTAKIVAKWADTLESQPAIEGSELENKRYSLTLHYREAKSPAATRRRLLTAASALKPAPEILPGKKVLNLLAPGHSNKGIALQALLKAHGFKKAIFVGDDDTDEDVFCLRDPRIFSVRVGAKKGSAAQAYLRDQGEAEALLALLLQNLGRRRP